MFSQNHANIKSEKLTLLNRPAVERKVYFSSRTDPMDRMLEGTDPLSMIQKQILDDEENEDVSPSRLWKNIDNHFCINSVFL